MPDDQVHEMQVGHLPFLDHPEETGHIINQFLSREVENEAAVKFPV